MTVNTSKCNHLTPLRFKVVVVVIVV